MSSPFDPRKKLLFMGTPEVAAQTLQTLIKRASHRVQVCLVVSQPPALSTRQRVPEPSPVHRAALEAGIPVLTPEKVSDSEFLNIVRALQPDICLTAAYGQYLPRTFLELFPYGVVNIHPSLLPRYRGAAPVQRSLEQGDREVGVSVLLSTAKMDAGPILAQQTVTIDGQIQAPELLNMLFDYGIKLFISAAPGWFAHTLTPTHQDDTQATPAPKLQPIEAWLDFSKPAQTLHNQVRAFQPWPGTKALFHYGVEVVEVRILETIYPLTDTRQALLVTCGDGQNLGLKVLQLSGKKPLGAKDFLNGLKGREFRPVIADHS